MRSDRDLGRKSGYIPQGANVNIAVSPGSNPALVLNADYRPLSYYPLSLWSWQDAIKAVFLERVNIVSEYEVAVRSPSFTMKLPSVVSLKSYVRPARSPAFTRFNVFLRDRFKCQYCGDHSPPVPPDILCCEGVSASSLPPATTIGQYGTSHGNINAAVHTRVTTPLENPFCFG